MCRWLVLAVVLSFACPGRPPSPSPLPKPPAIDDTAARVTIAQAEARRADGVAPLVELAARGAPHERVLALRGLGRIGGAKALDVLVGALGDPDPAIVGAAASAIGIATSLDEADAGNERIVKALVAALPRAAQHEPEVIEAIGRAGDASAIAPLVARLDAATDAAVRTAIVTAFGRYGRRKLELSEPARRAIVKLAGTSRDGTTRYAIAWALAREQLPKARDALLDDAGAALVGMLGDGDPQVRAQAANALGRRKWVVPAKDALFKMLADTDWRVGVEAARALTGDASDDGTRGATLPLVLARFERLEHGDEREAQVVTEGLRGFVAHAAPGNVARVLETIATRAAGSKTIAPLARGWIECLAIAAQQRAAAAATDYAAVASCGHGALPDHLRLPLLGELIGAKAGTLAARRTALRTLLAHADARVRVAGMTALDAMWKDGDASDHRAAVATVIAALGSPDPIVAGSAVDAATALYEHVRDGKDELDAAVVARARAEQEPELAAALLELIGKRAIASGLAACRDQLAGPPVIARAAEACMKGLGAPVPPVAVAPAQAPPGIDVASVVGRTLRWHVMTTRGDVVIALHPEVAPWAVATIVALTRKGFYDGLEFHRVVPNFVVQGGDPTQSGWGGPGFTIPAEPGGAYVTGSVGIADSGRDSGGSQWFVMHSPAPHLDGRYTWFGSVESGQNIADTLLIGDKVTRAVVEVR